MPDSDRFVAPAKHEVAFQGRTLRVLEGARDILDARGLADEYAAIVAEARAQERGLHSIVVVGAVNAGKSSVVNALLGAPELSPTGHDETTGTYLRFAPPTAELPIGRTRIDFADRPGLEIDTISLSEWVVVGRERPAGSEGGLPLGATVSVDSPYIGGVVIVDTPGSGGLNPAHARLAIATAERASVLVLVTDAGGRLTEPALEFLEICAEKVEAIIVVVNQIDKNPGWQMVAEEDRQILRERDRRYSDVHVIGISALHALQSLGSRSETFRAGLREASRLDELIEALKDRLSKADALPSARAVRQTQRLLRQLLDETSARMLALVSGPDGKADLERERERLEALQGNESEWQHNLSRELARAERDVRREIRERTDQYSAKWTEHISRHRLGLRGAAFEQLHNDMFIDAEYVYQQLADYTDALVTKVALEQFADVQLGNHLEEIFGPQGIQNELDSFESPNRRSGKSDLDPSLASMAFMSGMSLTSISPLLFPVGAGGVLLLNLLSREGLKNKRDALAHVERMSSRMRDTLTDRFSEVLWDYRRGIDRVFARELKRAIGETTANLQAIEAAQKKTAEGRETDVLEIQHLVTRISEQLQRGDADIRRLIA